jgi:hypothetical protein
MAITSHARALTWSFIESINHDSPAAVALVCRAHVEVAGLIAYLLVRLRKHQGGQLAGNEIHDAIVRLYMATKSHPPGAGPDLVAKTTAVNVATLVDSVDKLPELKRPVPFRGLWERLSEFCHPSMFSRAIAGERKVGREIHFDARPTLKETHLSLFLTASVASQEVFFFCRQEANLLIEQLPSDE